MKPKKNLREIVTPHENPSAHINPRKCQFTQQNISYISYTVTSKT